MKRVSIGTPGAFVTKGRSLDHKNICKNASEAAALKAAVITKVSPCYITNVIARRTASCFDLDR